MKLTEAEVEAVMESRFYNEWELKWINVEGKCMSLSWYILLMCIEDLEIYTKQNKKLPHKAWRVSTIKAYFNLSGTAKQLLEKLNDVKQMCNE